MSSLTSKSVKLQRAVSKSSWLVSFSISGHISRNFSANCDWLIDCRFESSSISRWMFEIDVMINWKEHRNFEISVDTCFCLLLNEPDYTQNSVNILNQHPKNVPIFVIQFPQVAHDKKFLISICICPETVVNLRQARHENPYKPSACFMRQWMSEVVTVRSEQTGHQFSETYSLLSLLNVSKRPTWSFKLLHNKQLFHW